MKKELQEKLYEKYPKIFKFRIECKGPYQPMFFGIETSDGWYKLIDRLCSHLQFDTDHNKLPQVEVVQVKEKFGTLRFYTNGTTSEQCAAISFAESLSYYICEVCGSMQEIGHTQGWITTLCKSCAENSKNKWEIDKD